MKGLRFFILLLVALSFATAGTLVITDAARADFCENCDPPPEDSGGGGPDGGGPTSAPAPITVSGTFTFGDFTSALVPRGVLPIVGAHVDVLRFIPGAGFATVASAQTDASGSFSVSLPFEGVAHAIRVYAINDAALVRGVGGITPFFVSPPETTGTAIASPGATLDFSTSITDTFSAGHFNVAETARQARLYAIDHNPDEGPPPWVAFQLFPSPSGSFYNHINDNINLSAAAVFNDRHILHEYAHFLQDQLSSFAPIPARHDGCIADPPLTIGSFGLINKSPDGAAHAWMEGFADYFAGAVAAWAPSGTFDPSVDIAVAGGTIAATGVFVPGLEGQPACRSDSNAALVATFRGDTVENFIAGTLWDLADPANETHDTLGGHDDDVFDIFDDALDDNHATWPTITDFVQAWRSSGLPSAALDAILSFHTIPVPPLAPNTSIGGAGIEPPPPPDDEVCDQKSWTPGCEPPK